VRARDRVEHPPDEGQRHVGRLERVHLAPLVCPAVGMYAISL
jgi:hypothetical protein